MAEIVVFITTPNEDEAAKIAHSLVEARVAGCVNMIRKIRSIYRWQDSVEDETEVLMVLKTQKSLFNRLTEEVKRLHSYEVPEIIAIPIVEGSEDYLKWLREVTGT